MTAFESPASRTDELTELREAVRNLTLALDHRDTIGCAKGVLMASQGVGREEAFRTMVRLSQSTGVKLYDLAGQILEALPQPVAERPRTSADGPSPSQEPAVRQHPTPAPASYSQPMSLLGGCEATSCHLNARTTCARCDGHFCRAHAAHAEHRP